MADTLILKDTQKAALSVSFKDAKGAPATVDGTPEWASSDTAVVTVMPGADGLTADVVALFPGTAQVSVMADADLGSGTVTISGTLDISVLPGQAATIAIAAGAPVEQ